jgi:hypothetical protein
LHVINAGIYLSFYNNKTPCLRWRQWNNNWTRTAVLCILQPWYIANEKRTTINLQFHSYHCTAQFITAGYIIQCRNVMQKCFTKNVYDRMTPINNAKPQEIVCLRFIWNYYMDDWLKRNNVQAKLKFF